MPTESGRILVVDDEEKNRDLMEALLAPLGYEVFFAENGEQALELANNVIPDIIMLDIMMPDIDGYEVLKRLKAKKETVDIPVIFVTALDTIKDEIHGLELGAIDYVTKPLIRPAVKARIKNHLELKLAQEELRASYKRLSEELALAKSLQQDLLPSIDNLSILTDMGLSASGFTRPASEVNGDFFSVYSTDPSRITFCLADCKGHGVAAGMMTMAVYAIVNSIPAAIFSAKETLAYLDTRLRNINPAREFTAMICGVYDHHTGVMRISSAGIPYPIYYPAKTNQARELELSNSPPLGLPRHFVGYDEIEIQLEPGDKLVFFSDGLTEALNEENEFFGIPSLELLEVVSKLGKLDAENMKTEIIQAWEVFSNGRQDDDCTLVVIEKL